MCHEGSIDRVKKLLHAVQGPRKVVDKGTGMSRSTTSGLRGCKNRPTPFPGRMSYKATKPGLVLFYILACFNCIVAY